MPTTPSPQDFEALKAALVAAEARATAAEAKAAGAEAEIAHLKLTIAKLQREIHGPRSERTARLLDQLELELEELQARAREDELGAEAAAVGTTTVRGFSRRTPGRKPFPAHLLRERVVIPGPGCCEACGSNRLVKIGEDVTETLEVIPRSWKVIQTVREKFSCRACETIHQPRAAQALAPRAGAVPCGAARLCRPKPAGDGAVREVRPAPAAESPVGALFPGRRRAQRLDPGRPGRRLRLHPETAL